MTTLAKVVGRTDDGGSIYLNSTDTSSDLIFAHPTLGVQREHFDGPCRKVEGNACVHYESVHVGGSTTITVTDKGLLLHTLGLCSSCMGGDHDFDTWRHARAVTGRGSRGPSLRTWCRSPLSRHLSPALLLAMAPRLNQVHLHQARPMCVCLTPS
jgi:hypothetical protein